MHVLSGWRSCCVLVVWWRRCVAGQYMMDYFMQSDFPTNLPDVFKVRPPTHMARRWRGSVS